MYNENICLLLPTSECPYHCSNNAKRLSNASSLPVKMRALSQRHLGSNPSVRAEGERRSSYPGNLCAMQKCPFPQVSRFLPCFAGRPDEVAVK